nr:hypothetical protein [Candidatus Njordarchaeota archaeon]
MNTLENKRGRKSDTTLIFGNAVEMDYTDISFAIVFIGAFPFIVTSLISTASIESSLFRVSTLFAALASYMLLVWFGYKRYMLKTSRESVSQFHEAWRIGCQICTRWFRIAISGGWAIPFLYFIVIPVFEGNRTGDMLANLISLMIYPYLVSLVYVSFLGIFFRQFADEFLRVGLLLASSRNLTTQEGALMTRVATKFSSKSLERRVSGVSEIELKKYLGTLFISFELGLEESASRKTARSLLVEMSNSAKAGRALLILSSIDRRLPKTRTIRDSLGISFKNTRIPAIAKEWIGAVNLVGVIAASIISTIYYLTQLM